MNYFGIDPLVGVCDEEVAFVFEMSRIYFI
jgi:hypothetical protein